MCYACNQLETHICMLSVGNKLSMQSVRNTIECNQLEICKAISWKHIIICMLPVGHMLSMRSVLNIVCGCNLVLFSLLMIFKWQF